MEGINKKLFKVYFIYHSGMDMAILKASPMHCRIEETSNYKDDKSQGSHTEWREVRKNSVELN